MFVSNSLPQLSPETVATPAVPILNNQKSDPVPVTAHGKKPEGVPASRRKVVPGDDTLIKHKQLAEAIYDNDLNKIIALFQKGLDPDITDSNLLTILHIAARNNRPGVIKVALDYGAFPSPKNQHGYTPLHDAAYYGHLEALEALIEALPGHLNLNEEDNYGCTALHHAVFGLNEKTELPAQQDPAIIKLLNRNHANLNHPCKEGYTPLHQAARYKNPTAAETLLTCKALPDLLTKEGKTPLYLAMQHHNIETARTLIRRGCSLDKAISKGCPPLLKAIHDEQPELIELLLENKASPGVKDTDSLPPIEYKSKYGLYDLALILLKHYPDLKPPDDLIPPLHFYLVYKGQHDLAEKLIPADSDSPAKPELTLKHTIKLLEYAKHTKDTNLEHTLKRSAIIRPTEQEKLNLLHLAAKEGCLKLAKMVLKDNTPIPPKLCLPRQRKLTSDKSYV